MPRVERIGVLGAGTMGSGIAQLAALGGYETVMHDPVAAALEGGAPPLRPGWAKGRGGRGGGAARLRTGLDKGAERGRWSEEDARRAGARLETAGEIAGLSGC